MNSDLTTAGIYGHNDESELQRAMEAYAEAKRREAEEAPWSPGSTSSAGGPSASSPAGLGGGPAMSEPRSR